jgi:sec-independent protein translocase protein TatB
MNLGFTEMAFIFLLALIIFGPRRLPEIGRQIGKALAEFKRYSNDFKYQLETEVRQWEIEDTLRKEKESLKEVLTAPEGTVASSDNMLVQAESSQAATESVYPEPPVPADSTVTESPNSILPPSKGSDA